MTDPDKTDPNLQRYLRADGWFDRHVANPLTGSAWTLAAFVVWTDNALRLQAILVNRKPTDAKDCKSAWETIRKP